MMDSTNAMQSSLETLVSSPGRELEGERESFASAGRSLFLRRVLAEPLVRFLIAGVFLFAAYAVIDPNGGEVDNRDIRVDEQSLLDFVQFRRKAFNETQALAYLRAMPAPERAALIDEFIREEALYREALAWGLDDGDYVIRRRLVQSLEFAVRGSEEAQQNLSETNLRQFYDRNKAAYEAPPTISFTHGFFSAERHGWEEARRLARRAISGANASGTDPVMGDRFLYHRNYVDHRFDLVASHFGQAMAEQLFALRPDASRWQGPLESPYGVHIVRLAEREAGGILPFEEVRDFVVRDAQEAVRSKQQQKVLDNIVASYRIRVSPELGRIQ